MVPNHLPQTTLLCVVLWWLLFVFSATLHSMWDLSSLTRNRTRAPCIERAESQPLNRQRSRLLCVVCVCLFYFPGRLCPPPRPVLLSDMQVDGQSRLPPGLRMSACAHRAGAYTAAWRVNVRLREAALPSRAHLLIRRCLPRGSLGPGMRVTRKPSLRPDQSWATSPRPRPPSCAEPPPGALIPASIENGRGWFLVCAGPGIPVYLARSIRPGVSTWG